MYGQPRVQGYQCCRKVLLVVVQDTEMDSGEDSSDGEDGGFKSGSNGVRRAAAAMAVGVGSLLDPQHLPVSNHGPYPS